MILGGGKGKFSKLRDLKKTKPSGAGEDEDENNKRINKAKMETMRRERAKLESKVHLPVVPIANYSAFRN